MKRTLLVIFCQSCLLSVAQPQSITIPAGTEIAIRTTTAISSKNADTSREYEVSLDDPLTVNGVMVAPANAKAWLRVTEISNPRLVGHASMSTALIAVTGMKGERIEVKTGKVDSQAGSHAKRTAIGAGVGAGTGAAIGSVGGGLGAGVGAATGAAAGAVIGKITGNSQGITIPSETRYTYTLTQPVTIDSPSPDTPTVSRVDPPQPDARVSAAAARPARVPLEAQLLGQYKLTAFSAANADIVTPGSVLILQKSGFSASSVTSQLASTNTYRDGQIRPDGAQAAGPTRQFAKGERLYVTRITAVPDKDAIVFDLISDSHANEGRYQGSLAFPYLKGSLASADLSTVQPAIAEVFAFASGDDRDAAGKAPDLTAITIGQTVDQVIAPRGQPDKISRSGTAEGYRYKDVRVLLVDGKVKEVY